MVDAVEVLGRRLPMAVDVETVQFAGQIRETALTVVVASERNGSVEQTVVDLPSLTLPYPMVRPSVPLLTTLVTDEVVGDDRRHGVLVTERCACRPPKPVKLYPAVADRHRCPSSGRAADVVSQVRPRRISSATAGVSYLLSFALLEDTFVEIEGRPEFVP